MIFRGKSHLARIVTVVAVLASGLFLSTGSADAAARITVTGAGDVRIIGTEAADAVSVTLVGSPLYEIIVSSPVGGGTEEKYSGIIRNLTIDTRGGDDTIRLDGGISGNANIKLGAGDDAIDFRNFGIDGTLRITDNTGDAHVFGRPYVDRTTTMLLGSGDNTVALDHPLFGGSVRAGITTTGSLDFDSQGGHYQGPLQLTGGNKADRINVTSAEILGRFAATTRSGDDQVNLADGTRVASTVSVRLGAGDDVAALFNAIFERNVLVNGDGDDDVVAFSFSRYDARVTSNGGAGTDRVATVGADFAQNPRLRGYEITN